MNKSSFNIDLLEKLLEMSSEGLIITNSSFEVEYAFPAALKMLGIQDFDEVINLKNLLEDESVLEDGVKNQITGVKHASGQLVPVIVSVFKFDDNYYLVKMVSGKSFDDRTDDLENQVNSMKEHSIAKSRFLASLSHDLKNPIQSLTGFSQALLQGLCDELTPKQERFISIINKNAHIMHRMINNVTDYSKLDANRLDCNKSKFILGEAVDKIKNDFEPLLEKKEIDFLVDIENCDSEYIYTDRELFTQIILSMLESSVKYTNKGFIKVIFSLKGKDITNRLLSDHKFSSDQSSFLLVTIIDSGKGISQTEVLDLFNEYVAPEEKNVRKYGLSGLNIILSKRLVELMGGSMWLDEDISENITFNFVIPVD